MLKRATWSILVKIFHKASAIPSQPSKNTVEWFQTRWNQEETNAQTPPKPVELLLSLHKELQGPGKSRALKELQVVPSPPQNCAWQRSNATQAGPVPATLWLAPSKAGMAPPEKSSSSLMSSAALPTLPLELGHTTRMQEKKHHCFHSYTWETRHQGKTGLQSNFFIILSLPKELQKQFSPSDFCQRL